MKSYILKSSCFNINYFPICFSTFLIFSLLFTFCSSTKETGEENEKEDEIYIFDEVPPDDSYSFEKPINNVTLLYKIQIGAFSTRERAELFAEKSRRVLNRGIRISYNDDVNLFVVQLEELFSSKIEAERIRANLWQMEEYNDAWLVPFKQKEERPD